MGLEHGQDAMDGDDAMMSTMTARTLCATISAPRRGMWPGMAQHGGARLLREESGSACCNQGTAHAGPESGRPARVTPSRTKGRANTIAGPESEGIPRGPATTATSTSLCPAGITMGTTTSTSTARPEEGWAGGNAATQKRPRDGAGPASSEENENSKEDDQTGKHCIVLKSDRAEGKRSSPRRSDRSSSAVSVCVCPLSSGYTL